MKTLKVVLAITALAGLMSAQSVVAAEKSPAIFPTDVLNQFSGAITTTYTYTSHDMDYSRTRLGVGETFKREMTSNNLQWKAQLGLGYGLQLGIYQDIELEGRDKVIMNNDTNVYKYTGGYNPTFAISWNPMQVLSPKNPLQALVSYTVKGKGIESKQVRDDYTQHTARAVVSYDLSALKLRPYIGYEHTQFGMSNNEPIGHENVILAGAEYAATKHVKLNLEYAAVFSGGQAYTDSYTTNNIGVNVEYKVPLVTAFDLYLVPSFRASILDDLTFNVNDPNISSYGTKLSVAYTGGFAVKAVF